VTRRLSRRLLTLAVPLSIAAGVALASGSVPRAGAEPAAARPFSTKLPLVMITTRQRIRDDPKVPARMRFIRDPGGGLNTIRDPGTDYDGPIGIEFRGNTSAHFPKRSYAIETRDARGNGTNVSLAGLPSANDWILYASYNDKTLMRNAIAAWTARKLRHYASRTVFVELFLNGRYNGVYVLMEKVKLGPNRVRVNARDVTGGYLLEGTGHRRVKASDRPIYGPVTGKPYLFNDPPRKDLTQVRVRWIRDYVHAFERALYAESFRDPARGYRRYLDLPSAVDYVLLNELFQNQDAFATSMFFSKSTGGKLRLGPVWDFDVSMGNSNYLPSSAVDRWMLVQRPWTVRLYQDAAFVGALHARWRQLRGERLVEQIARRVAANARYLRPAQIRNFRRWPVLGKYVWPNPVDPATGKVRRTYAEEVAYLRSWLEQRARWLDASLPQLARSAG
jgi:hypothetical protein